MIHPSLISLHPNEYTRGLTYYPFAVNLNRCVGSCNVLNDLSNRIPILNKTEDLNLHVFNMVRGINVSKTLVKHMSCKCRCKLHGRKSNSNQKWNTYKCRCECKNRENVMCAKSIMFGILLHVVTKIVNM